KTYAGYSHEQPYIVPVPCFPGQQFYVFQCTELLGPQEKYQPDNRIERGPRAVRGQFQSLQPNGKAFRPARFVGEAFGNMYSVIVQKGFGPALVPGYFLGKDLSEPHHRPVSFKTYIGNVNAT